MKFSMDSNCLIAIVQQQHPFHEQSFKSYARRVGEGQALVLSQHSRLEALSVLTRMPPPYKIPLEIALEALTVSFGQAALVEPNSEDYDYAVQSVQNAGLSGGAVYDALIVHTVRRHGVTQLISWNTKHMKLLAPPGLEVLRPDQVLL